MTCCLLAYIAIFLGHICLPWNGSGLPCAGQAQLACITCFCFLAAFCFLLKWRFQEPGCKSSPGINGNPSAASGYYRGSTRLQHTKCGLSQRANYSAWLVLFPSYLHVTCVYRKGKIGDVEIIYKSLAPKQRMNAYGGGEGGGVGF